MVTIKTGPTLTNQLKALTSHIVSRKCTKPVLNNICLKTNGDSLELTTTNLKTFCTITLEADNQGDLDCLVDMKTFLDCLPDGFVNLSSENNQLAIESLDGRSRSNIPILGKSIDFPKTLFNAHLLANNVDCASFRKLLMNASYAMCKDETREHIMCVRMDWFKDDLKMVSTDSHRLAVSEQSFPQRDCIETLAASIPADVVKFLGKFIDSDKFTDLFVSMADGFMQISFRNVKLVIRVIDKNYPPIQKVIPKEHPIAYCDAKELLKVLKGMKLNTKEGDTIQLTFTDGNLKIDCLNRNLGSKVANFKLETMRNMPWTEYMASYVIEALGVMEGNVMISLEDENCPFMLKDSTNTAIIMPIRK